LKWFCLFFILGQLFALFVDFFSAVAFLWWFCILVLILRLVVISFFPWMFWCLIGFFWGAYHSAPYGGKGVAEVVAVNYLSAPGLLVKVDRHIHMSQGRASIACNGILSTAASRNIFGQKKTFFNTRTCQKNSLELLGLGVRRYMYRRAANFVDLEHWLRGLYLGVRSKYISQKFKQLGIFHLLVVSGFHIGILGVFLLFLLKLIICTAYVCRVVSPLSFKSLRDVAHVVSVFLLTIFVVSINSPSAAQRALIFYAFYALRPVFGWNVFSYHVYFVILFIQMWLFPINFLTIGSLLSWMSFIVVTQIPSLEYNGYIKVSLQQLILCLLVAGCCGQLSIAGIVFNVLLIPFFSCVFVFAYTLLLSDFLPKVVVSFLLQTQTIFIFVVEKCDAFISSLGFLFFDVTDLFCFRVVCFLVVIIFLLKTLRK
jgi:hypothetical protein